MYSVGQYVVCGNKGVCTVENITTLDISGVDKAKEYYILKPLYVSASTLYIPVETAMNSVRSIMTKEEATHFVENISQIKVLDLPNEKMVEQEYRNTMKSNSCEEWARVAKTIRERKQRRLAAGRKETTVDGRYLKLAEENLFGELAVALEIPRSEVLGYIREHLQGYTAV